MIPSYPKNRAKITLPTRHNPGRGRPHEYLAYMTPEEMEMLRRLTDGRVEAGPSGVPSFADDSASSKGVSRGGNGAVGSGSTKSGSGTKSNTSSGGSFGGGGKMGSSSSQSGGTKSSGSSMGNSGTGTGGKNSGPSGGMMGGSLSGGPSRTSPSSGSNMGSSGTGTGGKNSGPGGGMMGGSLSGGPSRTSPSGAGAGTGGGNQGTTTGAGRDSTRGLGVGAGTTAIGRVPGSAGANSGSASRSVVNGSLTENVNRPKSPAGPFGAPSYNGSYNPTTGKYGLDGLGQAVNSLAKTDMEQHANRAGKADYGSYTTQAFGKTDMEQHVNRVDKADLGQTVNRVGKADMEQSVNRAEMGDLGGPMKGDLPSGVSYTAAAPSGVFGPRAQPPNTGYLNDLSHIGTPPSLSGPLQESTNPNPFARVNDQQKTIGFRSPKTDLQRTADIFDGPASKKPVSTAASPPPTVVRETARAPKTRGLDPYNVTPAMGGPLVDRHQFSTSYDPLSSVQAPTQRVNTAAKTDLPSRATYSGYSFDPSSALQAAAVDRSLTEGIYNANGIMDGAPAAKQPGAANTFRGEAGIIGPVSQPFGQNPFEARYNNLYAKTRADIAGFMPQGAGPKFRDAAGLTEIDVPGYPDVQRRAGVTGGLGVTGVNSNAPGAQKLDGGNMTTKGRDSWYGGGPTAENVLSIENYYDPSSSGPDVPASESPSQEGWWGGPSGDVPPSQREPLVDKQGWPNRVFNGVSRVLDNFLPGAGWGMRKMKDASIDRINQMSPAEQAALKERWDRQNAAYLAGNIGSGRGGDTPSGLGVLLGVGGNAYVPPGAMPMPGDETGTPAPPGATPPDPWNRRRVGNPADPYTYGQGPAYNYFTYGS